MTTDRLSVLLALQSQGVVPVFSHDDPDVVFGVAEACARAGARCVEFTNRSAFAHAAFAEAARRLAASDPSVILGVGSIVDAPTAALYVSSGAKFVVGPTLNRDVAEFCNRRMVAYSPGCGTATEIAEAQSLGCEIVKVFPGESVGGPQFVKAVLGPMPWTKIMPTGGVDPTEASLSAWFRAGIVAAGIGSKLITKEALAAKDYAAIGDRVAAAVATAAKVRGL